MIQAIKELKYWSSIENHYVDSYFLKFYCSVIQSLVHKHKIFTRANRQTGGPPNKWTV